MTSTDNVALEKAVRENIMYEFTMQAARDWNVEPSTVVAAMLIGGALLFVLIHVANYLDRRDEQAIVAARLRRAGYRRPSSKEAAPKVKQNGGGRNQDNL